jgi:hypothetical protein
MMQEGGCDDTQTQRENVGRRNAGTACRGEIVSPLPLARAARATEPRTFDKLS